MNTIRHIRSLLPPVLAIAVSCAVLSCNSLWFRQATKLAGEEAAHAALQSALTKAGVLSAGRLVDAVRMVVDHKDYGGAAAALAVALNEHNLRASQKLTSAQVIALMRLAEPTAWVASPRVANGVESFCDDISSKG
jgi:hypothetical protein